MFWITTLLHKAFAHARISEARNQSQNGVVSESVSPFDLFMSVAQVIVSVNPYKQLNIYGDDVVKLYDNREVCMYVCVCVLCYIYIYICVCVCVCIPCCAQSICHDGTFPPPPSP